ncbi:hypothetical protein MASR1M48_16490 [Lactococcus petauri]
MTASRIYTGDKVEKLTWNSINEFLEEQKMIERAGLVKGKYDIKTDLNVKLQELDKRFVKWKETLDFMAEQAKGTKKRVEDKGCHKIIPRAAMSQAISVRLYVLPDGAVQIQKNVIDVRVSNTRTGREI